MTRAFLKVSSQRFPTQRSPLVSQRPVEYSLPAADQTGDDKPPVLLFLRNCRKSAVTSSNRDAKY
jgi:hypothetical protein